MVRVYSITCYPYQLTVFPFHSLLHPSSFYAATFLCNLLRLFSRRTIYNAIHLGDMKEKKRKKKTRNASVQSIKEAKMQYSCMVMEN